MRANRTYGSEGGEGQLFPTPIICSAQACPLKNRNGIPASAGMTVQGCRLRRNDGAGLSASQG